MEANLSDLELQRVSARVVKGLDFLHFPLLDPDRILRAKQTSLASCSFLKTSNSDFGTNHLFV